MQNIEKETVKKKYLYLEIMRIIAIFFVIFNHTGNDGYLLYSFKEMRSIQFWIYLFISVFSKFSVPLYFAISGAVMLGREPELLGKLWKRVARIFVVLVFTSLFYYCVTLKTQGGVFDYHYFFGAINTVYLKYHLGFLYAYIVFLITLPFLQALVKALDDKYFYYMMAIALFYDGILPIVEYLQFHGNRSLTDTLRASWLISKVVLYPCIGYFLQHRFVIVPKKLVILGILNVVGIAVSCVMTAYKGVHEGILTTETFHNNFVLLNCIWIFCMVKYLFEHRQFRVEIEKLIYSMGTCTFGIYLIHIFFLELPMCTNLVSFLGGKHLNPMFSAALLCLTIFGICYMIAFLLKKIPILKQLL